MEKIGNPANCFFCLLKSLICLFRRRNRNQEPRKHISRHPSCPSGPIFTHFRDPTGCFLKFPFFHKRKFEFCVALLFLKLQKWFLPFWKPQVLGFLRVIQKCRKTYFLTPKYAFLESTIFDPHFWGSPCNFRVDIHCFNFFSVWLKSTSN